MSMLSGVLKMAGLPKEVTEMAMAFLDGSPSEKKKFFVTITKKLLEMGKNPFSDVQPIDGEDPTQHLIVTTLPDGRTVIAAAYFTGNHVRVAKSMTIEEIVESIPDEKLMKIS